jgi:ElaB/YqjD/DUF883 family membrane-anchored ribosome-binding protein
METYFNNLTAQDGTKEKLLQDLMTLVNDAEELVHVVGGQLAGKTKTELATALDRLKAGCRQFESRAAVGARQADRVIREHPYQSISVAFGLGLLLGSWITLARGPGPATLHAAAGGTVRP